ncbi:MAG TPA: alpha/beta hydrolase [Chthoniobacteraceae bacterium]|nr:alpha/beta hydrolase [Chthoniobacteraceae bacterium]
MKRWIKLISRSAATGVAIFAGIMFFYQHHLIWYPRHYPARYQTLLPKGTVELGYNTSEGKQCAFYVPPVVDSSAGPERVWVCFSGNGSLALDWEDFVEAYPNKRDGFLLIDYPGYGNCQGSAEPANIEESADKAVSELAAHLNMNQGELEPKLNVLGHSIGAGLGLNFATRHPVKRVVLFAPFTTLRAMGQRVVGWPLCWLLRHNIDNRARMKELAARPSPPEVTIFHGADDTFIPPEMGRSLVALCPQIATFHEVPGATHDTIVYVAASDAYAAMNGAK